MVLFYRNADCWPKSRAVRSCNVRGNDIVKPRVIARICPKNLPFARFIEILFSSLPLLSGTHFSLFGKWSISVSQSR